MKEEENHTIQNNEDKDNNISLTDSVDELSSYDNHPADLGTELADRATDYALNDHISNEMEKIDEALQAMEDGTYGKCKVCGKDIPYERLEAIPYTLYCVNDTPDRTTANDRPVEETILARKEPEYDSFETKHDKAITDDIESFDDVARYGTSETPADFMQEKKSYNDLYDDDEEKEGFTEDYESFAATDIKGSQVKTYQSKQYNDYEEDLDEENLESPLGDIPYKKRDSYTGKTK